jgi:hypothetical protein
LPAGCPKCGSDAVKRSHRQGLNERLASLFLRYPYRCRKCDHRFLLFGTGIGHSSNSKTEHSKKRRREVLLYGLGVLLFLALLSFIVRERNEPSSGG